VWQVFVDKFTKKQKVATRIWCLRCAVVRDGMRNIANMVAHEAVNMFTIRA
jgi:hypothetical protein